MVSIREASKLLDLSEQTVRRRLHTGELTGRKESDRQNAEWLIDLPDDIPQPSQEMSNPVVIAMAETIQVLKQELDNKNSQIEQLHVLLQGVSRALPAPPSDHRPWWRIW